jgi:hypothetical protein
MRENEIESKILTCLSRLGVGFFWKNVSAGYFDGKRFRKHASPFAINGTSDILGVCNGRFVAIEVKTETGKTSPHQDAFLKRVTVDGGICGVARNLSEALSVVLRCFGNDMESPRALAILKCRNDLSRDS